MEQTVKSFSIEPRVERVYGRVRNDRFGVVVRFKLNGKYVMAYPNYQLKWMPKYAELKHLKDLLAYAEAVNKK